MWYLRVGFEHMLAAGSTAHTHQFKLHGCDRVFDLNNFKQTVLQVNLRGKKVSALCNLRDFYLDTVAFHSKQKLWLLGKGEIGTPPPP